MHCNPSVIILFLHELMMMPRSLFADELIETHDDVQIEVSVGQPATLPLSLCNICVNKFMGDD
jgi:hypothetical protein